MLNTYLFKGKEILIEAPGNSNKNKIKNDLIWEINNFLIPRFDLYMFVVCNKPQNSNFCMPVSRFPQKYVVFHKLDDMFIHRRELSDDEINYYRGIVDPLRKMDDDVFREACTMENVDIDYVATDNLNQLLNSDITCKSVKSFNRLVTSIFPVYVSMFSSKEMRIEINQGDLTESIKAIVKKYCIKKKLKNQ